MNKRRSPQEKKRLSYSKDRRNAYGENDKSSRKNIARNKRIGHRVDRHRTDRQLAATIGPVDETVEARVDEFTRARRGSRWRKCPDSQLGLHVARQLTKRVDKGISAAQIEQARIEKVRRTTVLDGMQPRRAWRSTEESHHGTTAVGPTPQLAIARSMALGARGGR